ncbi:MAG TPA: hypothetical protein VE261_08595, partial [Gaiellaceae bacterium]|nr:hypothetical protein [Gaiellaceae bacterium]
MRSLFRSRGTARGYKVEYEHPTQLVASTFLRAIEEDDAASAWERLSRETRGLLEGVHAARSGSALHEAADAQGDERVREVLAPLRAGVLAALGGGGGIGRFGVSAARAVDRHTAYVLLLAEFGDERIVSETDWTPAHLLAFVHES